MICALDTMTMIYAMRGGGPTDNLRELQRRAHILLQDLEAEKAEVVIPTVAVAELLAGIAQASHASFLATLQEKFVVPPFDLRAASLAADLWQQHRQLPIEKQVQRSVLKADVLIIATAKCAGATVFYSHDAKCRGLASLVMLSRDLPTHSENMFVDAKSHADQPKSKKSAKSDT